MLIDIGVSPTGRLKLKATCFLRRKTLQGLELWITVRDAGFRIKLIGVSPTFLSGDHTPNYRGFTHRNTGFHPPRGSASHGKTLPFSPILWLN